jgi:EpsI family protein
VTDRGEIPLARQSFLDFPMQLKGWSGTSFPLEARYVEVLKFDDYLLADYQQPPTPGINLYIAYYRSQRKGQSAHSPQSCIPGGGWEISAIEMVQLGPSGATQDAPANRALIQKGDQRQLVLYWFKQRDRVVANEYLVKLYVFWDAMTRQRTDGALIRLTTPIQQNETEKAAERRLIQFAQDMNPVLPRYVPD